MTAIKTIKWADEARESLCVYYDDAEQTITQILSHSPRYAETIAAWEAGGRVIEAFQKPEPAPDSAPEATLTEKLASIGLTLDQLKRALN